MSRCWHQFLADELLRLASAKAPFYGTERRQTAMHLHAVAALNRRSANVLKPASFRGDSLQCASSVNNCCCRSEHMGRGCIRNSHATAILQEIEQEFPETLQTPPFKFCWTKSMALADWPTGGRKPLLTPCGRPTGRSSWRRDNKINRTKGVYLGMNLFQGYEKIESTRSIKLVNIVKSTFI